MKQTPVFFFFLKKRLYLRVNPNSSYRYLKKRYNCNVRLSFSMVPISQQTRSQIIDLLMKGNSIRKIAELTRVSKSTVHRQRKALNLEQIKQAGGRPGILSARTQREIGRLVESGKASTAVEATQQVVAEGYGPVCPNTVRRGLQRRGLHARIKPKKPLLSRRHRLQRLVFANKYKSWSIEDFKRVIWSDETKICKLGTGGRQYCWRTKGPPIMDRYVTPTVKFGGGAIFLWGCSVVYHMVWYRIYGQDRQWYGREPL